METIQVQPPIAEDALTASPEAIRQRFDEIIGDIEDIVTKDPEITTELNATPLQKNLGVTDKTQAYK